MQTTHVFEAIAALDLEPIKSKLMHVASGEGWSRTKADAMALEYRRFLYLMVTFPNEQIAPTVDVDTFWHYHILDTMKYAADCEQAFGCFLHHYPYMGLETAAEDAEARGGERMKQLYEQTFGEDYIRAEAYGPAVGQHAAYCILTPHSQAGAQAAYCILTPQQQAGASAAYCILTPQAPAGAASAYCILTPQEPRPKKSAPIQLRAQGREKGKGKPKLKAKAGTDVAYCILTPQEETARMMAGSAAGSANAYCILTPQQRPAPRHAAPVLPA